MEDQQAQDLLENQEPQAPPPAYTAAQHQQQQQQPYPGQQQQQQPYPGQQQHPYPVQQQQPQPVAVGNNEAREESRTRCRGVCAIVCGVFGVCGPCVFCGIAGISLGGVGLCQLQEDTSLTGEKSSKNARNLSCGGLALSLVAAISNIVFWILMALFVFGL